MLAHDLGRPLRPSFWLKMETYCTTISPSGFFESRFQSHAEPGSLSFALRRSSFIGDALELRSFAKRCI